MRLLVFGPGYTASRLIAAWSARGWHTIAVTRDGRSGSIAFDEREGVEAAIDACDCLISSVPPLDGSDPVLQRYGEPIVEAGVWTGYLSSTGVYGDAGGSWVDETAPLKGRRGGRVAADLAWQDVPQARIFRLPGIYGPGRSMLERVRDGRAHRIDLAGQVFSRIHVDDIVGGMLAGIDAPPGVYNLSDDLPAGQNAVVEAACDLIGLPYPSMQSLAEADLSPAAAAFYDENRRVANGKARRVLGWRPLYPDFSTGLRALSAMMRPTSASAAPIAGSGDQT